jgi:hypothetical protein
MAAKTLRDILPQARDWLIGLLAVAAVIVGSTVASTHLFDNAKSARIAAGDSDEIIVDSIYQDRIKGALDPDYDPSRYQTIARSLKMDPVYFDGYPEFEIDEADIDSIRTEIAAADTPIYVAFLNVSELDDADGDLDLLAARIITEMDDAEAAVLTVNAHGRMGLGERGRIRPSLSSLSGDFDDSDSFAALEGVRAVTSARTEDLAAYHSYRHDDDGNPEVSRPDSARDPHDLEYSIGGAVTGVMFGLILGVGAGAGIIFITRAMKTGAATNTARTAQQ